METYLRKTERFLRKCALEPHVQRVCRVAGWTGTGFFLSAAGLSGTFQPLSMGLICAITGWRAMVLALGAAAGYRLFWGASGVQGMVWAGEGFLIALLLGKKAWTEDFPLILPALTALVTAVTGLVFLLLGQAVSLTLFFLRVCLAPVSAWFFRRAAKCRDSLTDWALGGIAVLALARVAPVDWLGAGYIAAGVFSVWASFPAAALAGLGLDLAQITALPMAVIVSVAWFGRMIPFREPQLKYLVTGGACLIVMGLCGIWDIRPLPGMVLGGILGYSLPPRPDSIHRRGAVGIAQVRLELTAGVLAQTQQLLLEVPLPEIDEASLLRRAVTRACGNCVSRERCEERLRLNLEHLQDPLSFACRHPWQIQGELLHAKERVRDLRADHQRQLEYRKALVQQYQFLSVYLQRLSDQLPRRGDRKNTYYRLEVSARSRGKEPSCGDRCMAFPGTGCRYYVLLCDGMGTGLGAAQEGQSAGDLLKQMLTAGFPPEHAFRSVNSILVLRGQAGAVTLDLVELRLDSGSASLYKWGAAPSYVLGRKGAEKIGTATPPPGISLLDVRETVDRLSLRRGEMLILVSDGAEIGEVLRRGGIGPMPPGELAEWLLKECNTADGDDATVAVMRLVRRQLST